MRIDNIIYFIGCFWLSVLLVSSAYEFATHLEPAFRVPVIALGVVLGFVIPAVTYVALDGLVEIFEKWRNK